jgi:hypothetical protein
MMREIQELDRLVKIDANRRQEIIEILGLHVTNPELFREDRERWSTKIPFSTNSLYPQSWYDAFIEKMLKGMGAHPNDYELHYYENWYRKSREVCKLMKAVNDNEEPMTIEWIPVL